MIALENVSKVYHTRMGPFAAIDGVNLRIGKSEKIGILGRNGAGKSTLIRLIGGAEYPTSGRIRREMSVSWPLAFGGAFHPHLTGYDNLRFICRVYGVDFPKITPFVEDFTELGSFLREPVQHYSAGMTSRLAFALSLAIEFDCFLIDEVISVGDHRFHEKCREELFEKRRDRAMILVSHDAGIVKERCERAAVIKAGKLQLFNTTDEAYAAYLADAA